MSESSYPQNTEIAINFDTNYSPYWSSKQILEKLEELVNNKNIEKLSFTQCDLHDEHLEIISQLTSVKELSIYEAKLNGKLEYISNYILFDYNTEILFR